MFLETFSDPSSAGSKKVLAVIDYVVQHNYGIYFDADVEERLIKAGIAQFREWHEEHNGDMTPEDALRGLAQAKEKGEHTVREMLERKVRSANSSRPHDSED